MKILRDYQIDAIRYLRNKNYGCLFMEMRLGKTLTMIRHIKQLPNIKLCLVVGPYSVLDGWKEELYNENFEVYEIFGSKKDRQDCLHLIGSSLLPKKSFWLINKEGFLTVPEIKDIPWDCIILDESFIRNPKAKVTKFFCRNFRNTKHRYLLTGTPAPEGEHEYYTQLQFVDPTILNFTNYWDFHHSCFRQFGYEWKITKQAKDWLSKKLNANCFFLTRKQAGIKNQKIYETRTIELPSKMRKIYNELEENFWVELEGQEIRTPFAGAKYSKLKQLCSGIVEKKLYEDFKIIALRDLINGELKNEQVIIWATFTEEIIKIQEILNNCQVIYGKINIEQRNNRRKWFQQGKTRILVIQPETFKYGTNLSSASTMIYFSSPESLITRQQSEDRTVDISLQNGTLIIDMPTKSTVQEDILKSLKNKENKDLQLRRMIEGIKKRRNENQ